MEYIIAIGALLVGSGLSYFVFNKIAQNKGNTIINEAKKEAEQIKKKNFCKLKKSF